MQEDLALRNKEKKKMHSTRNELIRGIPLPKKGTKYVARASRFSNSSVPVVIAIRDMLHLASTMKEVKQIVHKKMLKINGKTVSDLHQPIPLFGILHADKDYRLSVLTSGRFNFEETHDLNRATKVVGKVILSGGVIQYGLHDGTNIVSKENISVGDTIYLDFENKIKKHVALNKGKKVFIISGNNLGMKGIVSTRDGQQVTLKLDNHKEDVVLNQAHLIAQ